MKVILKAGQSSYRMLFDKNFNLLRPKSKDDSWVTPFNPNTGANFQKI